MRQIGWYWMPAPKTQHFIKDVTACFYEDSTQVHSYTNQGPMIMDNFGQLVSCTPQTTSL